MAISLRRSDSSPKGGCCQIPLSKGRFVYVDKKDYAYLSQYTWTVKMSHSTPYVVRRVRRDGREFYVRMHREIMQTPEAMQCHHRDFNTFDCRRRNLSNLCPRDHEALHILRRLTRQNQGTPSEKNKRSLNKEKNARRIDRKNPTTYSKKDSQIIPSSYQKLHINPTS